MLLRRAMMRAAVAVSKYVPFADPKVLEVLIANGVSSDGVGITTADVEKVTSIGTWFKGNTEITSFDEFEKFTGVTAIGDDSNSFNGSSFYQCTALVSIAIPKSVSFIGYYTFRGCASLKTIAFEDLSSIKTLRAGSFSETGMEGVVYFPELESIEGQCFNGTNITRVESLGKITTMPGVDYGYNQSSFDNCNQLTYVEIPETVTSIGGFFIGRAPAMKTLVLRATTPPTLSSVALVGLTMANITIYVPDASIDTYKAATNWAKYAAQIKPLSEYNG